MKNIVEIYLKFLTESKFDRMAATGHLSIDLGKRGRSRDITKVFKNTFKSSDPTTYDPNRMAKYLARLQRGKKGKI
jgi:hypothetical protein